MQRRTFLTTIAGTAGVIAGCLGGSNRALPDDPGGDWSQQAHDCRNTGAATVTVPPRGNQAWDAGAAGSVEPLVADGTVFAVGSSVTALDARTGEQDWETELSAQTGPTPALTDDLLLVPAGRRLVALNRDDGSERWSTALPRPAERALTVDLPVVTVPLVARQGSPGLVAFDTETGDRLWDHRTLAARATAIDGGRVFTTGYRQDGETGILRALSIEDGSLLWETELAHPDTEPVVADGELLVTDEGALAVHNPEDGTRRRTLGAFGDRISEPPAAADGLAFLGSQSQEVVAISITDGSTLWRRSGSAYRGLSVGTETVVTSGESLPESSLAGLAAFDRADGTVRWEHQIEGLDAFPSTAPVLASGAVYYTSNASSGVVALGDVPGKDDE
jgi:outer membrane protein assembly factor BamB